MGIEPNRNDNISFERNAWTKFILNKLINKPEKMPIMLLSK